MSCLTFQFPALCTVHAAFTNDTWLDVWLLTLFSLLEFPPHTELLVYFATVIGVVQWCTFKQLVPITFCKQRLHTLLGVQALAKLRCFGTVAAGL